jgi:hypothetical protein
LLPLSRLRREGKEVEASDARRIGTQAIVFAYFAATLSQFAAKLGDRDFAPVALRQGETDGRGTALADRLAAVPQIFSRDLATAWKAISELLAELGVAPVPLPIERSSPRFRGLPSANGRRNPTWR